jgi:hypothetical protein
MTRLLFRIFSNSWLKSFDHSTICVNNVNTLQIRHEDKDLRDDTAFIMNNANGCIHRVTYHCINVGVGLQ